jgi:hypothetical protein
MRTECLKAISFELTMTEKAWVTTAEVKVQADDMSSGDTLGFMRVTSWAPSLEEFCRKLELYLANYQWTLLSMEKAEEVDPSRDYSDEVNQMIEETLKDPNAVRLGTYYSSKATDLGNLGGE